MSGFKLQSLCFPSKIYLAISVISIIFMLFTQFQVFSIFVKIFFTALWTWVLNIICNRGYETLALILVALPYILAMAGFAIGLEVMLMSDKKNEDD